MSPEQLFWGLVEPLAEDPAVTRSTMMGLPCLRLHGRFFASLDRRSGALLVKLPGDRVGVLIAAGQGEPFAPAGRVFREWVAIRRPDRRRWRALLSEARDHAAAAGRRQSEPAPTSAARRDTTPRAPATFAGFGAAGLEFLAGLADNNTKAYFDAHRPIYERQLLAPAKLLVTDLGESLRAGVSARLAAVPRVGGSIFRIANDRRFVPQAPPYKPHLDLAFWEGDEGPRVDPSLILRITPGYVLLGAGVYALTGRRLERYREALHDPASLAALDEAVRALVASGAELGEPTRPRPPKRFGPDSPATGYAMRERLHVTRRYPVPNEITTARLVGWCAERLQPFATLHGWLTRHIG